MCREKEMFWKFWPDENPIQVCDCSWAEKTVNFSILSYKALGLVMLLD